MQYHVIKEGVSIKIKRVLCYAVLIFFSLLCLFFFYMLIMNATRNHNEIARGFKFLPGDFFVANFKSLFNNSSGGTIIPVFKGMRNSMIVSSMTAVLAVYFSAMTAYAIHVYHFKGRRFIFNFILLIMTVPTQVSALGFIRLMEKMNLMNTLYPLFIPAIAAPITFFFMKQYMDSSLPLEIVEAARIDGSGEFKTFNKIVMPIMKPALAVQAIFTFVSAWNNFFVPSLIIKTDEFKTLPIWIWTLRSKDWATLDHGQSYMMILMAILPVMIVYFALSKFIVAGVALGGVKE